MTDIVVCADAMRNGPGTQPPGPDYVRLETDLNTGAAGHFVYIAYKKGRHDPPITDIYIMGGRKVENLQPPPEFEQIPLDLNIQNWGNWYATSWYGVLLHEDAYCTCLQGLLLPVSMYSEAPACRRMSCATCFVLVCLVFGE